VTFTSSVAGSFQVSDVDREIVDDNGSRAVIVGFTSDTVVTADVVTDFIDIDPIPAGEWGVNGSPVTDLTPSDSEPEKKKISLTAASDAFRASNVGDFVKINGGIVEIIEFTSSTVVQAQILGRLQTAALAPGGSWSLEVASWSVSRGFPRVGGFFEQRLFAAGTPTQPYTFWGSRIGDFENFAIGPDDDNALEFTISTQETNIIRWMVPGRSLMLGTSGEEWEVSGGVNQGITPSNVKVRSHTTHGANNVAPLRVGSVILFIQRAGKKMRELKFNFDIDSFNAADLMLLNPDITREATVVDMAYQQEPISVVWVVLSDGTLLSLTYEPDQNIWAWARHNTGATGKFKSVAVIPHPSLDRDRVWFLIERTIDGITRDRFEFMDDNVSFVNNALGDLDEWLKMDSAVRFNEVSATNTLTGLDHLVGETVEILADGIRRTPAVVTNFGTLVFDGAPANVIDVGLQFSSLLETLRPGIPDQQNNILAFFKRWVKSIALVLKSGPGMTTNGDDATTEGEDPFDIPPAGPISSLLTAIFAFWKLEEVSGTRFDEVGSNDLTDINTVTQVAGKVGNAAQFTRANSEGLEIADNADLSVTDQDFSISAWVRLDSKPGGNMSIVVKDDAITPDRGYHLLWNQATDRFRFQVSDDSAGTNLTNIDADNLGAPNIGQFYHIVAWHDSVADTINIVVDDGTIDSAAFTFGTFDNAATFGIGMRSSSGPTRDLFFDGRIDATGFWKKVLTTAERTELNNSNNGIEHPFTAGGVPTVTPDLFSGFRTVRIFGHDEDAGIVINIDEPYPLTILALTGILEIGDE